MGDWDARASGVNQRMKLALLGREGVAFEADGMVCGWKEEMKKKKNKRSGGGGARQLQLLQGTQKMTSKRDADGDDDDDDGILFEGPWTEGTDILMSVIAQMEKGGAEDGSRERILAELRA